MGQRVSRGEGIASLPYRVVLIAALAAGAWAQGTIGSFPEVAVPPGNPMTPEKIALGKALFFEEQLSSDDTMACATCHMPETGGADPRAGARQAGIDGIFHTLDDELGSPGMVRQDADADYVPDLLHGFGPRATNRHAPTVIGAAFFGALFWDMRATGTFRALDGTIVLPSGAALERQAVDPPLSAIEMAHDGRSWDDVVAKLARVRPLALASDLTPDLADFLRGARGYAELFERAFGTREVTRERVAMAIASYERTLVPDRTPFDLGTLTPQESLGLQVFRERGNCEACHPSVPGLFSDGFAHTISLPGHFRFTKTPTLRNVGLQRRLTSSGQMTTLAEAVDHYASIGFLIPLSQADRDALVVFLGNGLTDPRVLRREPPFDRPTLQSEREPPGSNLHGEGWPGSGGIVPEILAHAPATLGTHDFQLGVGRGLGGAPAFLLLAEARGLPGQNLDGVPLAVDPATTTVEIFRLEGEGPGGGQVTRHAAIPRDPALLGVERFAQWLVHDPNALGGFSATRGARIVVVGTPLPPRVRPADEPVALR